MNNSTSMLMKTIVVVFSFLLFGGVTSESDSDSDSDNYIRGGVRSSSRGGTRGSIGGGVPDGFTGSAFSSSTQQCNVEVDVVCLTTGDNPVECKDIPIPSSTSCSGNGPLHTIDITFDGYRSCSDSVHNQPAGSSFQCTEDPNVVVTDFAYLTCYDTYSPNDIYCSCYLTDVTSKRLTSNYGQANSGQSSLPTSMTCDVTVLDQTAQTVIFDTSGSVDLNLQDKIGMLNINGCTDMARTAGMCSGHGALRTLDITFDGQRSCGESVHNQAPGTNFECTDYGGVTVGDFAYLICYDTDNTAAVYCQCFLTDEVSKRLMSNYGQANSGQSSLPDSLTCDIRIGAYDGPIAQTVRFDTSGSVDLRLEDKIGMLNINGCMDMAGTLTDSFCRHEIDWYYIVTNTGQTTLDITDFTSTLNTHTSHMVNLMDSIGGTPHVTITPNNTLTLKDPDLIDTCKSATYTATVHVEATSNEETSVTSATTCQDTEESELVFNGIGE